MWHKYKNGYLLGQNLEWYINRWNVISPGNETPHQYSRIISSKASHTGIHKMEDVNTSLMKVEGTQNLKMVELVKAIWKYLLN